jgi:spore coat polysaccharide biosynthesis protein SpsF (cytidylyltransferase family)
MKRVTLLTVCVLPWLFGCAVDITNACDKYQKAVGPEVVEYVNADGVVTGPEAEIVKADATFQEQIKAGPTLKQAKEYSATVGTPWLKWVDADPKLDATKKKRRHNTKEDFDRAMQAVETGN